MPKIKSVALNCENLFYYSQGDSLARFNRTDKKLKDLARNLVYLDADIYFLSEVGGEQSLMNFNRDYLKGQYIHSLIPGNSDRGIELGVLIKKELPWFFFHTGHKKMKIDLQYSDDPISNRPSYFLSRDILELRVSKTKERENPSAIFLFVHLKSQWDREGRDFRGQKRRQAEVEALVKVANHYNKKYPQTPIIALGDFNGNAAKKNYDPEFTPIYQDLKINWIDLFDILELPPDQRVTTFHFDQHARPLQAQLDYCFIPLEHQDKVCRTQSGRALFINEEYVPQNLPQSPQQRALHCSDHLPIVLTLENL